MKKHTVENIMTSQFNTVSPWCSMREASDLIGKSEVSLLPVLDDDRLIGIITPKNIIESHPNRLVIDTMTKDLVTLTKGTTIWEAKERFEKYGIRKIPILDNGRVIGILTKEQLYFELGKNIDAMTELWRADYLRCKLLELINKEKKASIIFLDLNGFGEINKKYGHVVGDEILQKVAKCIRDTINDKTDFACRYGGDEFSIATLRKGTEAEQLVVKINSCISRAKYFNNIKVSAAAGVIGICKPVHIHKKNNCITLDEAINMASYASAKAKISNKDVIMMGVFNIAVENNEKAAIDKNNGQADL
ncbi:GGDEF domain-containing protein [Peptococcaceae bacterium]|nr:GGDEF domain-containing protein [Peptococcaceae bacterium]